MHTTGFEFLFKTEVVVATVFIYCDDFYFVNLPQKCDFLTPIAFQKKMGIMPIEILPQL